MTRRLDRALAALFLGSMAGSSIAQQNTTTQYGYDANGNLTQVTSPLNQSTRNSYDALNRLIKIIDPANGQTQLAYNGQDRLIQVTDPRNLITSYTLDGLGNLSQQTSPDSGNTQLTVDAAGNPITRTDGKGQISQTQYDALNRVTQVTYADGRIETLTWDLGPNGIGRIGRIVETLNGQAIAQTDYGYDPQGRVLTETRILNGQSATTTYSYSNGDLISLSYPSGKRIDYGRDSLGRINQVTLTDKGQIKLLASQIQYHPFGGIKGYVNGAGQTITRSQDLDGRTTSYTLGTTSWQLGYDAASRISYQTDTSNAANTVTYGYDSLDHLTQALLPNTNLGYSYDPNGNRIGQTIGGNSYSAQISASSNRLQSLSTVPPKSYGYDANGSLTAEGTHQYSYDARGRLIQAQTQVGSVSYQIDALGRRIRKTSTQEDTAYSYDRRGHLIAEADAVTGQVKKEYVWINDLPLAVLQ